jgi:hypothetical protein
MKRKIAKKKISESIKTEINRSNWKQWKERYVRVGMGKQKDM